MILLDGATWRNISKNKYENYYDDIQWQIMYKDGTLSVYADPSISLSPTLNIRQENFYSLMERSDTSEHL